MDARYARVMELVNLDLAGSPFAGVRWPVASQTDLDALTTAMHRPVPDHLAYWLKICNGSMAGPGGLYGAYASHDPRHDSLNIIADPYCDEAWRERGWIPVAGDGCGNRYVIDASCRLLAGTGVFFVDTAEDPGAPAYGVASDLPTFLTLLLLDATEGTPWPFDQAYMAQHDPMLSVVCPDQLLPWNTA